MDVIERMDKARKLGNVFYLYLVFSIVNVLIHIGNYYNGFLNNYADYALYVVKIIICFMVIKVFKAGSLERYRGIVPIMKLMIICDALELYLSCIMSQQNRGIAFKIAIALMAIKIILDFFFYLEIIESGRDRKAWIALNLVLLALILLATKAPAGFYLGVVAAVIRWGVAFVFIRSSLNSGDVEERDSFFVKASKISIPFSNV